MQCVHSRHHYDLVKKLSYSLPHNVHCTHLNLADSAVMVMEVFQVTYFELSDTSMFMYVRICTQSPTMKAIASLTAH